MKLRWLVLIWLLCGLFGWMMGRTCWNVKRIADRLDSIEARLEQPFEVTVQHSVE